MNDIHATPRRRLLRTLVCVLAAGLIGLAVPTAALAQSSTPPASAPTGIGNATVGVGETPGNDENSDGTSAGGSVWEILRSGGVVGLFILLLSVVAVALAVEHMMTIRAKVLMPEGLGEDVRQLLGDGNVAAAEQRCRQQPSFLAFVLSAGLGEVEGGWTAVEKAVEDAVADQSARLFRKIEYLSVIGNIAPMLGLLGTVIGMIFAFREVADTQGAARAADLATGIYLALVTTVEGLIVAIPALGAFAIFRNRVDQLVAETAYAAQHALGPLKRRGRTQRPAAGPAPAGPTPPMPPGLPRGGRG
ncbi:MAG: MotA/TolQ/ExbB proton channel family protein [Pirellulaceae bacterium]|nr:MotA/TolQ/ExbB proton channel family protein [Pirellulaceae bacterium]